MCVFDKYFRSLLTTVFVIIEVNAVKPFLSLMQLFHSIRSFLQVLHQIYSVPPAIPSYSTIYCCLGPQMLDVQLPCCM